MSLQRSGPARCPRTTESADPYPRYPKLVQGLTLVRPEHVWVGDITDIRVPKECVD